ncbi:hypothetical protein GR160_14760 [Flavobacterium sp. Sd200]|uniref:hypothetical protein n=1 Tax=Flavobacterium sp. Sd200 TaxID=2692211 RepID=UPI00136DA5AF|nr:hypothetical protein [Flavobacterium sp. Sd200]MXN92488.1 hypothetical protein [Flavobacterium sp. Sd200]
MTTSENNSRQEDIAIVKDEFNQHSPVPEGYQSSQSNEKYHTSANLQKKAVPHQRNELNPNQEQRPDRKNPQRNIDK